MKNGKKLNIGVMARHFGDKGGITVYSRNILRNIFKIDKFNQYFIFFPNESYLGWYKEFSNVEEIVIGYNNNAFDKLIWDQYRILKCLKKFNIDVLFNPKLAVPLFARCKTIFVMHGMEQFAADELFLWWDRLYFKIAMRLFCKKADAIPVMTETGRNDLKKYLTVQDFKIHVIPEAYKDYCIVIEDDNELTRVKKKFRLPEDFYLFIGGITPLKNLPTLLRAFKEIKNRGSNYKLALGGFKRFKFERELKLINKLELEEHTIELGFVEDNDLAGLYNLASCFILPSFYEGFGIPILEAQACGCPVIISERGAMREVAGEGGALYFNPDSYLELADRMENIIEDKKVRECLIESGFENVKKFSWGNTALKMVKLFEKLAN